jgi:hypothetical protein
MERAVVLDDAYEEVAERETKLPEGTTVKAAADANKAKAVTNRTMVDLENARL